MEERKSSMAKRKEGTGKSVWKKGLGCKTVRRGTGILLAAAMVLSLFSAGETAWAGSVEGSESGQQETGFGGSTQERPSAESGMEVTVPENPAGDGTRRDSGNVSGADGKAAASGAEISREADADGNLVKEQPEEAEPQGNSEAGESTEDSQPGEQEEPELSGKPEAGEEAEDSQPEEQEEPELSGKPEAGEEAEDSQPEEQEEPELSGKPEAGEQPEEESEQPEGSEAEGEPEGSEQSEGSGQPEEPAPEEPEQPGDPGQPEQDADSSDMICGSTPPGDEAAGEDGTLPAEGLSDRAAESAALDTGQTFSVTYETVSDYKHRIYANGQPLIITASSTDARYAELYVDLNNNGVGDPEEEITGFRGDGKLNGNGIYYAEGYGYFLVNSTIYGGGKDGEARYDTSIRLTGGFTSYDDIYDGNFITVLQIFGGNANGNLTGSSNIHVSGGNAWLVYGGSEEGTLTGSAEVNISGGNVGFVTGGGERAETNGNTSVHITGGRVERKIYGGGIFGRINGDTSLRIENAIVNSVFGGNEYSGTVTGNTKLVFGEGAQVNGWVYGGGAGFDDTYRTEVLGSANIIINGGEFWKNVYGGGAWRGAWVGGSNITVNGGTVHYEMYAGGEETSYVAGTSRVTVNGGYVDRIYASGAGYNGTEALVENVDIRIQGGTVDSFWAFKERHDNGTGSNVGISGSLSFELSGGSMGNSAMIFGQINENGNYDAGTGLGKLQDVNISLKNGKWPELALAAPISGNLSVTLEEADVTNLRIKGNVLGNAKGAVLSYINCGEEGSWKSNPGLKGSYIEKNQFKTILIQDSYVNFDDDSYSNDDTGLRTCTEKLIVDGGALRVIGQIQSNMPPTEFRNNPLILRTSPSSALHFEEIPEGSAGFQWLNGEGTGVPNPMPAAAFALTPHGTPDNCFVSGHPDYVIKTENVQAGAPGEGIFWKGLGWYVGEPEALCTCSIYESPLRETMFLLRGEGEQPAVTLATHLTGDTSLAQNCRVTSHRGKSPDFSYRVLQEGTTAPDAVIAGSSLTTAGPGNVHVHITGSLNGKSVEYDRYVRFLGVPEKDACSITRGMEEDLSVPFEGLMFEGTVSRAHLWDNSLHQYVDSDCYSVTEEGNRLTFQVKKAYLESLEIGGHEFSFRVPFQNEEGGYSSYDYFFTIEIVSVIEVNDPVIGLSEEVFHYDGHPKTPSVTVKYGGAVIPEEEYSVTYEANTSEGTARVIITDNPGGRYAVNGSRTFEIVNEYEAAKGTDYVAQLNGDGWAGEDFVIQAEEGYLLSLGNTLADEWVPSLSRAEETGEGTVVFYVKNTQTGLISRAVTESYKLDRTQPEEWDITFDGISVKRLPEEAVSWQLFGGDIQVGIRVKDSLSGIRSISWHQSERALSREELEAFTQWKQEQWTEEGSFSVSARDGEKCILYVKAQDMAGNILYFASEGGEFDMKAPVVGGVTDGSTYYVTQTVTVTEEHPGRITLNGKEVSGDIVLPGNRDEIYRIHAVDQVGNEALVTITMKPVSALAETISGIGPDTVKLSDQEILEKVEDVFEILLQGQGGDCTEEEKQRIEAELVRVRETLACIERVQTAAETIAALPDAEGVRPDDRAAVEAADQARQAWEGLTEHEKTLVDPDRLNRLLEALTDYRILEGDGSQWKKGTDGSIVFRVNGLVSKFTGILIDDREVDSGQYEVREGSTVIVLGRNALDGLSAGSHSIAVLYQDGRVDGVFEVLEEKPGETEKPGEDKPEDENGSGGNQDREKDDEENGDNSEKRTSPSTKDEHHLMQWMLLCILSGMGLAGVGAGFLKKKRK